MKLFLPSGGNQRLHPQMSAINPRVSHGNLPRGWFYAFASILGCLALANAAVFGYCTVFSKFAFYDDQGFMMVSVKGFLEGQPLYERVFSTYGPTYYFWEWLVHRAIAIPVTHDTTGLLCVFHWLLASILLGWGTRLLTRSNLCGFFAFLQAVVHLRDFANEPGHPQEVVVLLLGIAVCLAGAGKMHNKVKITALGAIGAALALTKVNVGAFYCIGLTLSLACHTPQIRSRPIWYAGGLVLCASFPFLLMRLFLGELWASSYALEICSAVLAVGAVGWTLPTSDRFDLSDWVRVAAGFGGFALICLGVLALNGTSRGALVDNLVSSSWKIVRSFCLPFRGWHNGYFSLVSLASAFLLRCIQWRATSVRIPILVAKLVYGGLGTLYYFDNSHAQLSTFLPWAWVLLVPGAKSCETNANGFSRTFLASICVYQGLQAFPVAGSQVGIGTCLLPVVFSVCLHDAFADIAENDLTKAWMLRWPTGAMGLCKSYAAVALLLVFSAEWYTPYASWKEYMSSPSLNLPGAYRLRLAPKRAEVYRELSKYVSEESDGFITVPGLNSLYFWTMKKPITYFNVAEIVLLNERQQEDVIAALRQGQHPMIVMNEEKLPFVANKNIIPDGPLGRFIKQNCQEVKRLGEFRILVPSQSLTQETTYNRSKL